MSQQIMLYIVSTLWRPYSPSSTRTGLVLDVSLNVGFDPPQSLQRIREAVAVLREHLISNARLSRTISSCLSRNVRRSHPHHAARSWRNSDAGLTPVTSK